MDLEVTFLKILKLKNVSQFKKFPWGLKNTTKFSKFCVNMAQNVNITQQNETCTITGDNKYVKCICV